MDVAVFLDDVVEGRNVVHDAKHHSTQRGKGQKEADGRDQQSALPAIGNALAQKSTQTSAAKGEQQCGGRRRENGQENPINVQAHGSLDLGGDADGKATGLSPGEA
jgi:hypothetical protein